MLTVTTTDPGYREVVRAFAAEHAPATLLEEIRRTGTYHDPGLHRAYAERGWIGALWPREVGGLGLSPAEFGELYEALNYHLLPLDLLELTEMAAFALLRRGTPAQQQRFLPAIKAGEVLIALGYSEPNAGSDVAAVQTHAKQDGDDWVINGSKMFTTCAHVADHIFLLTRTNLEVPKHKGLTLFLVPSESPGIEIQPIHTFGGQRTNSVFLTDVRVSGDAVVGDVNEGWSVLNLALDFERMVMASFVGQAQRLLDDLLGALTRTGAPTSRCARSQLIDLNVRIESARALGRSVYARAAAGVPFSVEAAMSKLAVTEAFKDLSYVALDVLGIDGLLVDGDLGDRFEHAFRHAQIMTIYGGSNEIQRNIIARRALDLPR